MSTRPAATKDDVAELEARCCLPLDPPRQRAEDAPNGKESAGPGRVQRGGSPCRSEGLWHKNRAGLIPPHISLVFDKQFCFYLIFIQTRRLVVSSEGPMAPRLQVSGSGTEWSGEEETGVNPLRRILPGEDVEVSLDLRD